MFLDETKYQELFQQFKTLDVDQWLSDFWRETLPKVYARIETGVPEDFLSHHFPGGLVQFDEVLTRQEYSYLNAVCKVVPIHAHARFRPSVATSAHHQYQVTRWEKELKIDRQEISTVVEWGGGYGDTSLLFDHHCTYVIIDIPCMSLLQWMYLGTLCGDRVNLIQDEQEPILSGRINLVPLPFVEKVPQAELFLSSYALSESSPFAQDYVIQERIWFGASRLLLVHEPKKTDWFPDTAEHFVDHLRNERGKILDGPPSGTEYFFR